MTTNPSLGFAAAKIEEHRRYGEKLQRLNYIAGELLIGLRRQYRNRRQYLAVQAEITAIACWMNFLVEQLERIIAQSAEQNPVLIKLKARIVCHDCRPKSRSAPHHYGQGNVAEARPDIAVWQAQVTFLLALTDRVAGDLFEQICASSDLKKVPECLVKLRSALLRQKRYLEKIGAEETKFLVESVSDRCAACGESIQIGKRSETPRAGLGSPN
jgi:hypothetical protein